MKIKDFLDISPAELSKLGKDERKELVDDMARKANRRLDELGELFFVSPALSSRLDDEGNIRHFNSEGKNHNQLGNELKNLQKFLGNKTSTVSGAKNSAIRIYAKIMNAKMKDTSINDVGEAFNYNGEKMKIFWEAYNKTLDANPGIITTKDNLIAGQFTSGQVQQIVFEVFEQNSYLDSDELWVAAQKILDDRYEAPKNPGANPFSFVKNRG